MEEQPNNNRFSLGVVIGIIVAILAAGGGSAWWAFKSLQTSENISYPTDTPITQQPDTPTPTQTKTPIPVTEEDKLDIYWLNSSGDEIKLVPVTVTIEKSKQSDQTLKTAFQELLAGSTNPAYTTTIPQGTKLISLNLAKDGVHINLSKDFTTGGGSTSMSARLGQIIYTASSLNPDTPVWIDIEGQPLEELGGEGLIIDQPMTRQDFDDNFSF